MQCSQHTAMGHGRRLFPLVLIEADLLLLSSSVTIIPARTSRMC